MKLKPVSVLSVFYEPETGKKTRVGRLAKKDRDILFEYDAEFISTGLELSPFKLPLRPNVVVGDRTHFQGLMGVFEDSLPDGWGRLLLDRKIAKAGLEPATLSPLDRLAWVGARGMGALAYEPEWGLEPPTILDLAKVAKDTEAVLEDASGADLDRLIALGGSPQGARPKALVQLSPDGKKVLYGAREIRPGFTPYLVKFRGVGDDAHTGTLELVYSKMARAAGVDVPEVRMLGKTKRHVGYFAVERFDRSGKSRLHLHTLSGLVHAPHTHASLTYRDLLLVTRELTRNEAAVSEMFRRACFNVFAHNRDDHTKNFAFLMQADGSWAPSPAYDLTYSSGPGGEHTLLVGTEGKRPTEAHLEALATQVGVKRPCAVIDEVRSAIAGFTSFAGEAELDETVTRRIAKLLEADGATRPKHRSASRSRASTGSRSKRASQKGRPSRKRP